MTGLHDKHHHGAPKRGGDAVAAKALFAEYGLATAECIALGIRMLASLWASAFALGKGTKTMLKNVKDHQLRHLYQDDPTFLPSYSLGTWIEHEPH